MDKTTVKICGLQSSGMLESILHLPIDYIGFVFAKSRRQITPIQAQEMIQWIRANKAYPLFKTVGVFVNPDKDEIIRVLREAALDVVQLHGQENADFCRWIKEMYDVQIFKVFSVDNLHDSDNINQALDAYRDVIDTVMLDTYDPVVGGGTGKPFAWKVIPVYQEWARLQGKPLIIAGGLDADNVNTLLNEYFVNGVDVSSGVETNGSKDTAKIISFVERVKGLND